MALITVTNSFSMLPNKTLFILLDLMSAFSSVDNSLLLETLFHLLVSMLARISLAMLITPFQSPLQLFTWALKHWFSLGSSLPTHFLGDLLLNVAWKKVKVLVASVLSNSATPWMVDHPASLSMEFSRQEHWSGLPFPSQGNLPDSGFEPRSPVLQADSLLSEPAGKP